MYPPVDVEKFLTAEFACPVAHADGSEGEKQEEEQQQHQPTRDIAILSCAQFRPEKDHSLQIEIMRRVRQKLSDRGKPQNEMPQLMVVGGTSPRQVVMNQSSVL